MTASTLSVNRSAEVMPTTRREARRAEALAAPTIAVKPRSRFHFPAVDGLRGIAIASVLLYHTNWSTRGLFGVDVFFVVSGFFITLVMLRELDKRGRIDFAGFYRKRAKRLVPGLLITLTAVIGLAWQFGTLQELQHVATRSLFSLLQIANWEQLSSGDAYWDTMGQLQPLAHMWSLSLTEQFYVLWPILVLLVWWIARRNRLAIALSLAALTIASALVAPLLYDGTNTDRLYLGTDARAVGFVAGAAAAALVFWWISKQGDRLPSEPTVLKRLAVSATSVIAVGTVIVASVMTASYHQPWLYQGGFALVAIASAIFIATLCSSANILTKLFAFSVFTAFGKVSYTVFLLHLPVFWVLQKVTPSIQPIVLFFVGGGLTWLLAAFVHFAITERMRLGTWKWNKGIPVLAASVAAIATLTLTLPQLRADQQLSTTPAPGADSALEVPTGAAGGRPVVLALGDSLATDFATMLSDHGSDSFAVSDGGVGGCAIMDAQKVRSTNGYVWAKQGHCHGWQQRWAKKIADTRPDVILLHLSWDAAAQYVDGEWIKPGDNSYDKRYRQQLDAVSALIREHAPNAAVHIANDRPANGVVTKESQMTAYNAVITSWASQNPKTHLLDWKNQLCPAGACQNQTSAGLPIFLKDDVHLATAGMTTHTPWLERQIASSLRAPADA